MSDVVKHVIVADSIGCLMKASSQRQIGAVAAFGLGVISHALMDLAEPDFTVNWFNPHELRTALPFLVFQVVGVALVFGMLFRETRGNSRAARLRLAAVLGGIFPDVTDGLYALLNPAAWYAGTYLVRSRSPTEAALRP